MATCCLFLMNAYGEGPGYGVKEVIGGMDWMEHSVHIGYVMK